MEFLEKIFTKGEGWQAWTDFDTSVLLMLTLGAFLLGFILAGLLYGARARRRRKEAEALQTQLTSLQAEQTALQEQFDLKDADLRKAELEAQQWQRRLVTAEEEKERLDKELFASTAEIERLDASALVYSTNIEDLNNQILGLKTKTAQVEQASVRDAEMIDQLSQMQSSYNATLNRLNTMETKLTTLSDENQLLRSELNNVTTELDTVKSKASANAESLAATPIPAPQVPADRTYATNNDVENAPLPTNTNKDKSVLADRIAPASLEDKDDLTQIEGVGPFIETKLNKIGIYTYEQISLLDDSLIEEVTAAIEFFPGRIKRDDWTGQATQLMAAKAGITAANQKNTIITNTDSEKKTGNAIVPDAITRMEVPTHKTPRLIEDDLKKIEGIGPKIEAILKKSGVITFQSLANTPVEELKNKLKEAGNRFKMHDPSTWPQQAQLASDGNWTKLKEYQDYLQGGKTP